jgi:hypothetical protein
LGLLGGIERDSDWSAGGTVENVLGQSRFIFQAFCNHTIRIFLMSGYNSCNGMHQKQDLVELKGGLAMQMCSYDLPNHP